MRKIIALSLGVVFLIFSLTGCINTTTLPKEMPEDFSFSIVWGTIHSYDSETGTLAKRQDKEYTTTYMMSEEELQTVYNLIYKLNIEKYDDEIGQDEFLGAAPSINMKLTVHVGDLEKTIIATGTAGFNSGKTLRAKKYAKTLAAIADILTATEEWQALPPILDMIY